MGSELPSGLCLPLLHRASLFPKNGSVGGCPSTFQLSSHRTWWSPSQGDLLLEGSQARPSQSHRVGLCRSFSLQGAWPLPHGALLSSLPSPFCNLSYDLQVFLLRFIFRFLTNLPDSGSEESHAGQLCRLVLRALHPRLRGHWAGRGLGGVLSEGVKRTRSFWGEADSPGATP